MKLKHLESRRPRVAVLGVYLALYDTAFPGYRDRMLAFARRVVGMFDADVDVPMVEAAVDDAGMARLLEDAAQHDVDGVVLLSLGYTGGLAIVEPLVKTPLPLLLLNTQEVEEVTSLFTFDDMVWNHGMQGIQDLAATLVRRGKPFAIVTGLLSQPDTRADLVDYLHAWRARRDVKGSRIGSFGPAMPGMGDVYVEASLLQALGVELVPIGYGALGEAARAITAEEVRQVRDFDLLHFDVSPELSVEDHERSIRLELGLRRLVEDQRLSGLQLSFEQAAAAPDLETIPFWGIIKLMGEGVAYAGEGDLLATTGNLLAHRLCGDATFTEMYTMDFPANATLHTHMAECNWRMARRDRKPRLLRRTFTLATCEAFAAPTFSLEPGNVTLFNLAVTAENAFRFITIEAEVMDFLPLAGMEIPNFKVRYEKDLRTMLNEYSLLGGTHHLSLVYGRHARRFQRLAACMNIECIGL